MSQLFDQKDFESLRYNLFADDGLRKILTIESFSNYHKSHEDALAVFKYISILYDKKSPLVSHFKDFTLRQAEAFKIAGIDPETQIDLTNLSDELLDLIVDFLKDQASYEWALIVSNESTFWEYQREISKTILNTRDDKQRLDAVAVKSKLLQECDVISDRLDKYYLKVFGSEDMVKKAKSRHALTPEKMARV